MAMLSTQLRAILRTRAPQLASLLAPASRQSVREALELLTPWDVGLELIRVGGDGDGGYLVPNDLGGIEALFSPGVSETWDFERFVADHYRMPSFMVDGSVEAPSGLGPLQHFEKRWLGAKSRGDIISLEDWIDRSALPPEVDLMLQMDIEGSEFSVLAATPLAVLRRFRVVVIEFHGLDWMSVSPILKTRILPSLRKMAVDFEVVHVHPNNCCGTTSVFGVQVPKVLEVTYVRRDRVMRSPVRSCLPHALDRDCVEENPSVEIAPLWPRRG